MSALIAWLWVQAPTLQVFTAIFKKMEISRIFCWSISPRMQSDLSISGVNTPVYLRVTHWHIVIFDRSRQPLLNKSTTTNRESLWSAISNNGNTLWCHWVFRSEYCYDWTGSDRGDRNNLGGGKDSYHVDLIMISVLIFFTKTLAFDAIFIHDITGTRLWNGYETSYKQFISGRKSYLAFVDVTAWIALDDTQLQSTAE